MLNVNGNIFLKMVGSVSSDLIKPLALNIMHVMVVLKCVSALTLI